MGPFQSGGCEGFTSDFPGFLGIYVGFLKVILLLVSMGVTLVVGITVLIWAYSAWCRFADWLDDKILGEGAKARREARRKAAIDGMFK
ncbi:hypothetical protein EPIRMAN_GEN20615_13010 [Ralstonia mannitolilytica]|uniref:hypothetical protein n=1 Tax=Ralstonia mannitolilytica TaxID=105219 RepID=UPI002432FC52|nr:hypothetical protein [Ralstonia mannitolilytica]